jgi:hypothetical protein
VCWRRQDRYTPAVQGDADRFLGALEAGADGEIDVHVGELHAEGARLGSPSFGQRDGAGGVAAERVRGVRCRLCVAGEDKQPACFSRHRRPPGSGQRWPVGVGSTMVPRVPAAVL